MSQQLCTEFISAEDSPERDLRRLRWVCLSKVMLHNRSSTKCNKQHPSLLHPYLSVFSLRLKWASFCRMSWKIRTSFCRPCRYPVFLLLPGHQVWLHLSSSQLVKQRKPILGVCLIHLAKRTSSYPTRPRIFQRENFWGWQQRVVFACRTAAF